MFDRANGLGVLSKGRNNNLNLIRMLAATMVLVSHSYVVVSGDPHSEPWVRLLGMTPGGVAVDAFFVLSGFLVMGSLQRSVTLWPFASARLLRIYPGLWVALLVSTIVIGAAFSELRFGVFMLDPQTWRYLLKNATMVLGAEAFLPDAFAHNPAAQQVNASLWTLRWELRLYILLGVMWWCAGLVAKSRGKGQAARRDRVMSVLVVSIAIALLSTTFVLLMLGRPNDAPRLGAMFFSGAVYWMYRDRLRVRGDYAFATCVAMAAGAVVSPLAFEFSYRLLFPYALMYLAFIPGQAQAGTSGLRSYNRLGDYSYGMYVYAFPVQQALIALVPGLSTWTLTALAALMTLAFAVCSWHFVERPSMQLRQRLLWRSASIRSQI